MKKGLILGAAAFAAMAIVGTASASDIKTGGYYMFRATEADTTFAKLSAGNQDNLNGYFQRLQLRMDFNATPKSHAHLITRVIDNGAVQGADGTVTATGTTGATTGVGNAAYSSVGGTATGDWQVRALWMETEAWGVGVKAGNMPISLNDNILVNHDDRGFGALMLAKSFGDTTVVLADVKVNEGVSGNSQGSNASGTVGTTGANADDADLYVLSLLGKVGHANYQLSGAYLDEKKSINALGGGTQLDATKGIHNSWLALTVGAPVAGVDLTGTLIYEDGYSNINRTANTASMQADDNGWLGALRAKGKSGIGEWNAYGFYSSKNFNNIINNRAVWSPTWDMSGPGSIDLMNGTSTGTNMFGVATTGTSSPTENMYGVGAGLKIKAGAWTVNPNLDYAALASKDPGGTGTSKAQFDNMWGGTLIASTEIDTGVTLALEGGYVKPKKGAAYAVPATTDENLAIHFLSASMKLVF